MKSFLLVAVVACLAVHVSAECSNMCSGHGVCGTTDMCHCYRNWRGADCSERTCQFGRSFVDSAQGDLNHDGQVLYSTTDQDFNAEMVNGATAPESSAAGGLDATSEAASTLLNRNVHQFVAVRTQWRKSTFELFPASTKFRALNHVYMECSNKGHCNRASGECACFAGYEGSSCQRTVCANGCSGHGVCRNIVDQTQSRTTAASGNYTYQLWDARKIQACVCDPGYDGVDCSQRLCPRGDDPLSPAAGGQSSAVIKFVLESSGITGTDTFTGSFRFSFTDSFGEVWKTSAISMLDFENAAFTAADFSGPLLALPNSVIPSITVTAADAPSNYGAAISITFTGNPGAGLTSIDVVDNTVLDGEPAPLAMTIVKTDQSSGASRFTNTECSSRGMCDYGTGVCDCFRGYRLADCSGQSALAF